VRSVLFAAVRPWPNAPQCVSQLDLWRVAWDGASWGTPQPLPAPINSEGDEVDAVEVASGAIYFSSIRNGIERPDLDRALPENGTYRIEPVAAINTALTESTLWVSADERVLGFSRDGDPAGLGSDDLFLSRRVNGAWSAPVHLAAPVSSSTYDYGPELAADGRTLTLTTHRSGQAGILAVDLGALP